MEFRIYHVTRNAAKHNYELDDKLYGSPLDKKNEDWALKDPDLYIRRVREELAKVNDAIEDMVYLMRENKVYVEEIPEETIYENKTVFSKEEIQKADAHAFHKFHVRQFEYVEKLSQQLQSKTPEEIDLIIPKARRQLNVLLAARTDLRVTLIRFTEYSKSIK